MSILDRRRRAAGKDGIDSSGRSMGGDTRDMSWDNWIVGEGAAGTSGGRTVGSTAGRAGNNAGCGRAVRGQGRRNVTDPSRAAMQCGRGPRRDATGRNSGVLDGHEALPKEDGKSASNDGLLGVQQARTSASSVRGGPRSVGVLRLVLRGDRRLPLERGYHAEWALLFLGPTPTRRGAEATRISAESNLALMLFPPDLTRVLRQVHLQGCDGRGVPGPPSFRPFARDQRLLANAFAELGEHRDIWRKTSEERWHCLLDHVSGSRGPVTGWASLVATRLFIPCDESQALSSHRPSGEARAVATHGPRGVRLDACSDPGSRRSWDSHASSRWSRHRPEGAPPSRPPICPGDSPSRSCRPGGGWRAGSNASCST
jgi:hypothetical protein